MGQDKSEIPKSSYDLGSLSNRGSEKDFMGNADSPVVQWLSIDAKIRLAETVAKLGLDSAKLAGKHLQASSMEDMMVEKKRVKNELKYYD